MPPVPLLLERLLDLIRATHTRIEIVHKDVPPPPPRPGEPFDLNRKIGPVRTPCYAIPGAPLEILIESGAWAPTGNLLVSCEPEVEGLLEAHPEYPLVRVELPPLPEIPSFPAPALRSWKEALQSHVRQLEATALTATQSQQWFTESMSRIETAIEDIVLTGREAEDMVRRFRHDRWHISSMNPHESTVNLLGHTYRVSFGEPLGQASDMNTLFLWPILKSVWHGRGRPLVRLKHADYGTKRLSVTVGRRGTEGKTYWIDLASMSLIPE